MTSVTPGTYLDLVYSAGDRLQGTYTAADIQRQLDRTAMSADPRRKRVDGILKRKMPGIQNFIIIIIILLMLLLLFIHLQCSSATWGESTMQVPVPAVGGGNWLLS